MDFSMVYVNSRHNVVFPWYYYVIAEVREFVGGASIKCHRGQFDLWLVSALCEAKWFSVVSGKAVYDREGQFVRLNRLMSSQIRRSLIPSRTFWAIPEQCHEAIAGMYFYVIPDPRAWVRGEVDLPHNGRFARRLTAKLFTSFWTVRRRVTIFLDYRNYRQSRIHAS